MIRASFLPILAGSTTARAVAVSVAEMKIVRILLGIWALAAVTVFGQSNSAGSCSVPTNLVSFFVEHGSNSFADCFVSGIPSGYGLTNGVYRAWCIEADAPIEPFANYTGRVYRGWATNVPAAFTNVPWNKLNYLLNHKIGEVAEVQNAVWVLLGQQPDLPFTSNSAAMVEAANQNGAGFVPAPGQPSCVLMDPQGSIQPLVLEFVCEVPAGLFLSAPRTRDGVIEFQLHGRKGARYTVQYSTNLIDWNFLSDLTATNDVNTVTDANDGEPIKVYRAREQ